LLARWPAVNILCFVLIVHGDDEETINFVINASGLSFQLGVWMLDVGVSPTKSSSTFIVFGGEISRTRCVYVLNVTYTAGRIINGTAGLLGLMKVIQWAWTYAD